MTYILRQPQRSLQPWHSIYSIVVYFMLPQQDILFVFQQMRHKIVMDSFDKIQFKRESMELVNRGLNVLICFCCKCYKCIVRAENSITCKVVNIQIYCTRTVFTMSINLFPVHFSCELWYSKCVVLHGLKQKRKRSIPYNISVYHRQLLRISLDLQVILD